MFVRIKTMIEQKMFVADFRNSIENVSIGELDDEYENAREKAEEISENRANGN